jgi:site-specific recombinase XerD
MTESPRPAALAMAITPEREPSLAKLINTIQDRQLAPAPALKALVSKAWRSPKHAQKHLGGHLANQDNPLQIHHDIAALAEFLLRIQNRNTRRRYQQELERAFLWCLVERQKVLSDCTFDDFAAYQQFLRNRHDPHAYWCGTRGHRETNGQPNAHWRPFLDKKKLTATKQDKAIRYTMTVISRCLQFWCADIGYLRINILTSHRLVNNPNNTLTQRVMDMPHGFIDGFKSTSKDRKIKPVADNNEEQDDDIFEKAEFETYIPYDTWLSLIDFIEAMPRKTLGQRRRYQQTRFVIHGLYATAARIHEFVSHPMTSMVFESTNVLKWHVFGKHNTDKWIVPYQHFYFTEKLYTYRQHLKLPCEPVKNENIYLVMNRSGKYRLSVRQCYNVVKNTFQAVAATLNDEEQRAVLNKASPHWIRHSVITHRLEQGDDIQTVKEFARHKDFKTTLHYVHTLGLDKQIIRAGQA